MSEIRCIGLIYKCRRLSAFDQNSQLLGHGLQLHNVHSNLRMAKLKVAINANTARKIVNDLGAN